MAEACGGRKGWSRDARPAHGAGGPAAQRGGGGVRTGAWGLATDVVDLPPRDPGFAALPWCMGLFPRRADAPARHRAGERIPAGHGVLSRTARLRSARAGGSRPRGAPDGPTSSAWYGVFVAACGHAASRHCAAFCCMGSCPRLSRPNSRGGSRGASGPSAVAHAASGLLLRTCGSGRLRTGRRLRLAWGLCRALAMCAAGGMVRVGGKGNRERKKRK